MKNYQVSTALKCNNLLGECCFWYSKENSLIWTDIEGKAIWKLNEDNKSFKFNLPDRAGFILPRKKEGFVIGFPKFIAISNQDFSSFKKICDVEVNIKETRINDAKVDPYGGIVFGTQMSVAWPLLPTPHRASPYLPPSICVSCCTSIASSFFAQQPLPSKNMVV